MDLSHAPIVFLHIPKTAGQTVHNCLSRVVKARRVSPIRVHTQASTPQDQYPPGYSLYSGHLDWTGLGHLPAARFLFTVLRDPGERIASFYYYLQREAAGLPRRDLDLPQNIGLKRVLDLSADDYFLGGDSDWQVFIRSHYDNFYCTYFATRRMLGWGTTQSWPARKLLVQAQSGLAAVDGVYSTHDMPRMEADFRARFGIYLKLADRFDNTSGEPTNTLRWPRLLASLGSDHAVRRMQDFVALDHELTRGFL